MQGGLQGLGHHLRHQGEAECDKPLHVAGAAADEASISLDQRERIAGPGLAFHGHNIGMPGKHDTTVALRTDGGPQIGLRLAVRCRQDFHGNFVLLQIIADPMHQRHIGAGRDGIERDQAFQDGGEAAGHG